MNEIEDSKNKDNHYKDSFFHSGNKWESNETKKTKSNIIVNVDVKLTMKCFI